MNHRPFDDWLLADESLTSQQKSELQAHLRTCAECAALAEVNLALKSAKGAVPEAGFVDRFQVRLQAQKRVLRARNFWGYCLLVLSAAGGLLWIFWPVLEGLFRSPVNLLASWLSYLLSLWASLQAMGHVSSVLLRVVPGFIPTTFWALVLLAGGGWSLLWAFSLVKLTKYPQGG